MAIHNIHNIADQVGDLFGNAQFLKEIAKQESNFGRHPNTYRKGYHGGVWQVDKIGFNDTQDVKSHPKLKNKFKKIKERFGINWENVKWKDLRKPLYSAIAARLLLSNKEGEIPDTLEGRAKYWKYKYNTEEGRGKVEDYLDNNREVDKNMPYERRYRTQTSHRNEIKKGLRDAVVKYYRARSNLGHNHPMTKNLRHRVRVWRDELSKIPMPGRPEQHEPFIVGSDDNFSDHDTHFSYNELAEMPLNYSPLLNVGSAPDIPFNAQLPRSEDIRSAFGVKSTEGYIPTEGMLNPEIVTMIENRAAELNPAIDILNYPELPLLGNMHNTIVPTEETPQLLPLERVSDNFGVELTEDGEPRVPTGGIFTPPTVPQEYEPPERKTGLMPELDDMSGRFGMSGSFGDRRVPTGRTTIPPYLYEEPDYFDWDDDDYGVTVPQPVETQSDGESDTPESAPTAETEAPPAEATASPETTTQKDQQEATKFLDDETLDFIGDMGSALLEQTGLKELGQAPGFMQALARSYDFAKTQKKSRAAAASKSLQDKLNTFSTVADKAGKKAGALAWRQLGLEEYYGEMPSELGLNIEDYKGKIGGTKEYLILKKALGGEWNEHEKEAYEMLTKEEQRILNLAVRSLANDFRWNRRLTKEERRKMLQDRMDVLSPADDSNAGKDNAVSSEIKSAALKGVNEKYPPANRTVGDKAEIKDPPLIFRVVLHNGNKVWKLVEK